jgi:hypothetical protein
MPVRLKERLSRLEQATGGFVGGVFIRAKPGEASNEACARYEAENGPIGDRMAVILRSVSVPRGPDSFVRTPVS